MSHACLTVSKLGTSQFVTASESVKWCGRSSAFTSSMVRKFALVFLIVIPVFATALLQMSMDQMTAASTEIVEGTVTGSYTAMSGKTIFTHYKVEVTQRMKGPANATADVAIPGGSFNHLRQSFAGVPILQVGQQYLLFLWQGATGPNQPVGLNQGVFAIEGGSTSAAMASRPAVGETMLDSAHRRVIDRPVSMRLSDVHARVAAVLSGTPAAGAQVK